MGGIIDRFEGSYAVVEFEGGGLKEIQRLKLPQDAHEGDVIEEIDGDYVIDHGATKKRRQEITRLMDSLLP